MASKTESGETKCSVEQDVQFERMRNMPKNTTVYSVHRQLSWQCIRNVKRFERDRDLITFELRKGQTSMTGRLAKLQEAQKQIGSRRHSDPGNTRLRSRCNSEPVITSSEARTKQTKDKAKEMETVKKNFDNPVSVTKSYHRGHTIAHRKADSVALRRRPAMDTLVHKED